MIQFDEEFTVFSYVDDWVVEFIFCVERKILNSLWINKKPVRSSLQIH
jgi:hypothetical protein